LLPDQLAHPGKGRKKGWIRDEVFLQLSKDFSPSLFWNDLKSDRLFAELPVVAPQNSISLSYCMFLETIQDVLHL
jgi:hypothetical protein